MSRNSIILIALVILTAIAGLFVYPHTKIFGVGVYPLGLGEKILPWRLGLDIIGGTHLVYDVDLKDVAATDQSSVLNGLRDIMEKRVNLFGVSEPVVLISKTAGKSYLIIELAGIKNPAEAISQIGRTAFLNFQEVREAAQEGTSTEPGVEFTPTALTGRYLTSARLTTDQIGQPQVAISFNNEGAKLFADITGKNIGKPLAIFIDNQLISSPRVNERISGGSAVITGVKGDEAKALVNLLNAGALPAPV
ncbi:protein translocase subunit SecD, partial [Candidatus Wolfebacteria bacterium]|nr:protein translocase subunit SecD [Candidatus Wolfebacteria bacterium]